MSLAQAMALGAGLALLVAAAWLAVWGERSRRVEGRLWADAEDAGPSRSAIGRWLALSGDDRPTAVRLFWLREAMAVLLGLALAGLWWASGANTQLAFGASAIPVFGAALERAIALVPAGLAIGVGLVPVLLVRAARRDRVASLEQDLPSALETMATLAESGLGFEAALDRYVTHTPPRPLVREFGRVQNEIRAGEGRSIAMRRLAERTDMPSIRSFVSAWIQAEEAGAGLVEILRTIADDLSRRSRERALARAEALPEKLVFPLVAGFLPGILVWTLGPAVHRLVGLIDAIMRTPR